MNRSVNLRSARFDLDSVYGGGPSESPSLYRSDDRFLFLVESGGLFEDRETVPPAVRRPGHGRRHYEQRAAPLHPTRGEPIGPLSLPTRKLLRHLTSGIPSGQDVAQAMSAPTLAAADMSDIDAIVPRLAGRTPLWLYILREADVVAEGLHLGPVGGRIVAEVFIGLLQMDRTSFVSAEPDWRQTLPTRAGDGNFTMADLLRFAGVDPTSRDSRSAKP